MQHHTTFETAKRLKRAGFPQPQPEVWQFWYLRKNLYFFQRWLTYENEDPAFRAAEFLRMKDFLVCEFPETTQQHWVFAPTATDILIHLPLLGLHYMENGNSEVFVVNDRRGMLLAANDNPAEAVAAAWLAGGTSYNL